MSGDDERTVFRSSAPEVVDAWENAQRLYREWHAAVGVFGERFPDHVLLQRRGPGGGSVYFAGLRGDTSPGDGWRHLKDQDCWLPDKRYKAGKALAVEADKLRVDRLGRLPGMPDLIRDDGALCSPGIVQFEGVVYVMWGCPASAVKAGGWSSNILDESLWEPCPLSAYYLAIEAKEAAGGAESSDD